MAAKGRFGILVGTGTYVYFYANKSSYQGLEATLGLVDVDGDTFDGKVDRINVRSKLRTRIAIRYEYSATVTRTVRLWCATKNLETALATLATKTYNSKDIKDAYIPNRYGIA